MRGAGHEMLRDERLRVELIFDDNLRWEGKDVDMIAQAEAIEGDPAPFLNVPRKEALCVREPIPLRFVKIKRELKTRLSKGEAASGLSSRRATLEIIPSPRRCPMTRRLSSLSSRKYFPRVTFPEHPVKYI